MRYSHRMAFLIALLSWLAVLLHPHAPAAPAPVVTLAAHSATVARGGRPAAVDGTRGQSVRPGPSATLPPRGGPSGRAVRLGTAPEQRPQGLGAETGRRGSIPQAPALPPPGPDSPVCLPGQSPAVDGCAQGQLPSETIGRAY